MLLSPTERPMEITDWSLVASWGLTSPSTVARLTQAGFGEGIVGTGILDSMQLTLRRRKAMQKVRESMLLNALSDRKWTWLLYTVLFGMVPILIRILIASVMNDGAVTLLSPSDFISLGIVLQVSLLNEVRYHDALDVSWRHRIVGLSTFIILFYAALYAVVLLAESVRQINISSVLNISIALSAGSFGLCWVVYDRMTYPGIEGVSN